MSKWHDYHLLNPNHSNHLDVLAAHYELLGKSEHEAQCLAYETYCAYMHQEALGVHLHAAYRAKRLGDKTSYLRHGLLAKSHSDLTGGKFIASSQMSKSEKTSSHLYDLIAWRLTKAHEHKEQLPVQADESGRAIYDHLLPAASRNSGATLRIHPESIAPDILSRTLMNSDKSTLAV